jgi:hypothetical protein
MDFLQKQEGIEAALAQQAVLTHSRKDEKWGGPYCIKQAVVAAMAENKISIYAAMLDYQEPDLTEIEEEILIEYGYGSEEFAMDFRIVPNDLARFEIMLRYPRRNPRTPQNPRGAGQVRTGESLSLKISGMPDGMFKHLQEKRSEYGSYGAYLRVLIEKDLNIHY